MKIVRAYVVEQTPHPMAGHANFAVVVFESDDWVKMNRRRIKRERNKAIQAWKRTAPQTRVKT